MTIDNARVGAARRPNLPHVSGALLGLAALGLIGCGEPDDEPQAPTTGSHYVLSSVVIQPDDARTTYVQVIDAIDERHYTNGRALEIAGNGVVMAHGKYFYVGLEEEPTWVRYEVDPSGDIVESGRISFLGTGASAMDYGNAIVDDQTAISVFSGQLLAVVWNPTTMEITGEIDLSFLNRDGYGLEVWTTVAHGGRVYVPGRWANWDSGQILPEVFTTIIDPKKLEVVGTADDDRCASGGRVVFDEAGYGYVLGDGRNYSIQMFANASGGTAPENCLLRIPPGGTDFEADYYYTISSLTGGREAITEIDTAQQGSGLGFVKIFYPEELPPGVEPVDFEFWDHRAHKMWRFELADPPTATEVDGAPFSAIGFDGSTVDGKLFTGESLDNGATSDVYEMDPVTNTARPRFTMDGYFYGLYELTE